MKDSSSSATTGTAQRGLIDTMVQGAIVELFQSYGVAVAPKPRDRSNFAQISIPDVSAAISFSVQQGIPGRASSGRMTLSVPDLLFALMKLEATGRPQRFDWVRELTNQLAARLKHRLLPFDVTMQPGLPNLLSRAALEGERTASSSMRFYQARTLRGDVVVTVNSEIDESLLSYTRTVDVANAGDVILF